MDPIEPAPRLPANVEAGPHRRFLDALITSLTFYLSNMANRVNEVLPKDGTEAMDAQLDFGTFPVKPPTYTVATLPTASSWTGGIIYVSDGTSGQNFRGSHGGAWVNLG